MNWLYLLALLAGAALPVQVGLNTGLRQHLGRPMQATFVSFLVGALGALVYCLAARYPVPAIARLSQAPWWMWLGGLLGAFYVWSAIVVAPQVGAALTLGLVVAGQMTASLVLDHFGALGLPEHPVNIWRILGALLVMGGVALTAASQR